MTDSSFLPLDVADARARFAADGYLLLPGLVERVRLSRLATAILDQYRSAAAQRQLFAGGGNMSGHLNCFPGSASRFVYAALAAHGVFALAQELSGEQLRLPNIGCNLNLAGSSAQNEHIDGYADKPFLVANVAAVDTDLHNGAMEILPGTHARSYKYWEIALGSLRRKRVTMQQGDVLLRISSLWHRGMPNHSLQPRPMLAFTWEDGGSTLADPYAQHDGQIRFLPNRFNTDWRGRLLERAFVTAPRLGTAYHVARSLFS
jgi:hypothetical protein